MTIIGLQNDRRFHYADDNDPAYVVIYRQRGDGDAEWVAMFNTMFPDARKEAYAFAQRLETAPHFEEILILEADRSDWPDVFEGGIEAIETSSHLPVAV